MLVTHQSHTTGVTGDQSFMRHMADHGRNVDTMTWVTSTTNLADKLVAALNSLDTWYCWNGTTLNKLNMCNAVEIVQVHKWVDYIKVLDCLTLPNCVWKKSSYSSLTLVCWTKHTSTGLTCLLTMLITMQCQYTTMPAGSLCWGNMNVLQIKRP